MLERSCAPTVSDSDARREGCGHCPPGVGCVIDQLICTVLNVESVEISNSLQNTRSGTGGSDQLDNRVVVLGSGTRVRDAPRSCRLVKGRGETASDVVIGSTMPVQSPQ